MTAATEAYRMINSLMEEAMAQTDRILSNLPEEEKSESTRDTTAQKTQQRTVERVASEYIQNDLRMGCPRHTASSCVIDQSKKQTSAPKQPPQLIEAANRQRLSTGRSFGRRHRSPRRLEPSNLHQLVQSKKHGAPRVSSSKSASSISADLSSAGEKVLRAKMLPNKEVGRSVGTTVETGRNDERQEQTNEVQYKLTAEVNAAKTAKPFEINIKLTPIGDNSQQQPNKL